MVRVLRANNLFREVDDNLGTKELPTFQNSQFINVYFVDMTLYVIKWTITRQNIMYARQS